MVRTDYWSRGDEGPNSSFGDQIQASKWIPKLENPFDYERLATNYLRKPTLSNFQLQMRSKTYVIKGPNETVFKELCSKLKMTKWLRHTTTYADFISRKHELIWTDYNN